MCSSDLGSGFVGIVLDTYGEAKGMEFLRKLAQNQVVNIPVASRQVLDNVIAGEYAIALQIKQLHVLKNYIKQHQVPDTEFDVQRALATGANQLQVSKDINNWTAARIYQRRLPLWMEHLKPLSHTVIKDMDHWFSRDPNHAAYQNYHRGVDYLGVIMPKNWIDPGGIWCNFGIRTLVSRPRYLGT